MPILRTSGLALLVVLGIVLLLWLAFYIQDKQIKPRPIDNIDWGVMFSQKMSQDFGLDWKANYSAIVHDLKPQGIRLVAYWDLVQPTPDTWDFTDLDWQVDEAEKAGIPIVIAVGQKVPRWPECHYPDWLDVANKQERESRLLTHLQKVAEHYKDRTNIAYWQVENEAFLHIEVIKCPKTSYKFVQKEVATVKQADPNHKVMLTDSGQVGSWYKSARLGDALGLTYYLKVHNPKDGHYRYPYFPGRVSLMPWLTGKKDQPHMIIEQQAEPWSDKQIYEQPVEDGISYLTLDELKESINKGRKLGFEAQYLWGVEWWYWLKEHKHTEYWDLVKSYAAMRRGSLPFPEGFLWGASTASHQVEGSQNNDWTGWEKDNADRLAAEAPKKFAHKVPDWSRFENEATNPQNCISGVAADAYQRYGEDFSLAQDMGMNAQRISVEWARIEPHKGEFDQAALAHYQDVVRDMKTKGMEPFVTLWHYTLPTWFVDQGGWQSPTAQADYLAYVAKVTETLGSDVTFWLTMNEPGIYASQAYLQALRPPQKMSPVAYVRVLNQLADTHMQAYDLIKAAHPSAQVGLAYDVYSFEPKNHNWLYRPITRAVRWWFNHRVTEKLAAKQDFLGLNYYMHVPIGLGSNKTTYPKSDLGWKLHPDGMYTMLMDMKQYNKPIYITENGLADVTDTQRGDYIKKTLIAVQRAITDGAPVKGYLHWSLTDNFEWDKGFWPRFGLIAVDYKTQVRTLRHSAAVYKAIITNNRIVK